jgi:VWFA-related protein
MIRWQAPALGALILSFGAINASAAGPTSTVNQVDVSAFPRVRVAVSVADGLGVPITGLDAQAFEVKEDDQVVAPLRVDSVVESQEPVATALVIDVSGSMADNGKIDSARGAATAFLDTLGARDSAAVISFADSVNVVHAYSSDRDALKGALASLQAKGDTALYDAIGQTAQLQGALPQRRKVLLILTDGADTRSQTSLETAIDAARQAGVAVFAIGLGDDVNRDVLEQIAGSAGQAVFVSDPTQLRDTFVSVGDRLRRQYVLEYVSGVRADNRSHGLLVKTSYRGQTVEGKSAFTAPRTPLAMDVRGLTNVSRVDGVQRVEVAVGSGQARQIELLVDEQSRGISTAPPFTFEWNTLAEKPGIHKVIVRGTDVDGTVTDKEFALEVAAPAVAQPTVVARPTAAPTPVTQRSTRTLLADRFGVALAAASLLLLAAGMATLLVFARRTWRRRPVLRSRAASQLPDDRTELIVHDSPLGEVTVFSNRRPVALLPRGKLLIGPDQDVAVAPTRETTIGRDGRSTVVLQDPQVSRHHARILFQEDAFWIEDLGSINGTRVNGEAVTRHRLQPNEQIGVGDAVLTFVLDPAS